MNESVNRCAQCKFWNLEEGYDNAVPDMSRYGPAALRDEQGTKVEVEPSLRWGVCTRQTHDGPLMYSQDASNYASWLCTRGLCTQWPLGATDWVRPSALWVQGAER